MTGLLRGERFYKMTGSGNDFVFFDRFEARGDGAPTDPEIVGRLCDRGTGVGADGVVFVEPSAIADVRMTYLNRDGSRATMCGNAALCTVRLATSLGRAAESGLALETDLGVLGARLQGGLPEIDLPEIAEIVDDAEPAPADDELRIGFALVGVPHLVVRCGAVDAADVVARGSALRRHPSLRAGANVNFVSPAADGWHIRTYERGVEAETLACGTGAIATAALLTAWGESAAETRLSTRSGRDLVVTLRGERPWRPSLRGEGRLVFSGTIEEL